MKNNLDRHVNFLAATCYHHPIFDPLTSRVKKKNSQDEIIYVSVVAKSFIKIFVLKIVAIDSIKKNE